MLDCFMLALATFAIGTDAFIIAGILPQVATDLAITISSAGLLVSVFSIAYAISAPLVSASSSRIPRKTVLVGGLAVFTVANILSAACSSLPSMLATRVLAALAAGAVTPTCYAVGSSMGSQSGRGRNLAVIGAGFTSSMVLGAPFGVYISRLFSWRASFIFVALLAFVAAAALLKIGIPTPVNADAPVSFGKQMRAVGRMQTLYVLAPFLLWSGATYGLYTYMAVIFGQHLSADLIPILLMIFGVGAVGGNILAGYVSDRLGVRHPTTALLVVLMLTLASVGIASTSLASAVVLMAVWAVSGAGLFTLQQQRVIASHPDQTRFMLALNNSALYFGASIGSALEGGVIAATSLGIAPLVSAGVAGVALILLLTLPRPTVWQPAEASIA